MARRKAAPKREILPDPLFRSKLLAKFINAVMRNGKKSVAENIVYGALDIVTKRACIHIKEYTEGEKSVRESSFKTRRSLKENTHLDERTHSVALEKFKEALSNVTPIVEVKSRRVGGSTYQVPVEIRAVRRQTLAMRWVTEYANKRNEKTMILRLANEILDAVENRGGAVKKKEDVHRMAKANQAFAHYRW
ncbi:MAG: 30S ribosomal protein S7 [Coxiella endosymbiont of Dermacentor nuttalli]